MTKFWGKLFLINFALGVVTGITMEFQFGMNWAEYSRYVGDIFGAPLAIEATVAFFLESIFIGVWIFGWNKISKKVHAVSIWLVALATNLSALWILLANGWMQHPVGYRPDETGQAPRWSISGAMLTNPYGWLKFFHTVISGYVVAAFFVMGISAWHLLRKNEPDFFKRSFRMAAVFGLASPPARSCRSAISTPSKWPRHQPAKFAAMESVWETQTGVPIQPPGQSPMQQNEEQLRRGDRHPEAVELSGLPRPECRGQGPQGISRRTRPPVLPDIPELPAAWSASACSSCS